MAEPGFKYFALHYLDLWVSQDRECCEALEGKDREKKLRTLAKAAWAYRIARNLPTRYDTGKGLERYGPVLDIIENADAVDFRGERLLASILRVKKKIARAYGGRGGLSLATKFLWLKMKSPIIIYDSRARAALGTKGGDIDEYYSRWREQFWLHEDAIREACSSLRRAHEYTRYPEITTPQYISEKAAKPWFRERVFDVYLWQRGLSA